LGTPHKALVKATDSPYALVFCDQIIDEVRRVFNRKFPTRILEMERFFSRLRYDLVTLTAEDTVIGDESKIRDVNDRPILRAARKAGVDVFVTGDKDFLESDIVGPKIVTASQFLHWVG
jgi:predicted nucleic acid-binding protein